MAKYKRYTNQDKAFVYTTLQANGGNIARSSRETGVPEQTIRDWSHAWAKEGPSQEIVVASVEEADRYVTDATRIRNKALDLIELKLKTEDPAKLKLGDLNVIQGTLTDKIRLIKGQPTSRTETVGNAVDPAQLGAAMIEFVAGAVQAAKDRKHNIEVIESNPIAELDVTDT